MQQNLQHFDIAIQNAEEAKAKAEEEEKAKKEAEKAAQNPQAGSAGGATGGGSVGGGGGGGVGGVSGTGGGGRTSGVANNAQNDTEQSRLDDAQKQAETTLDNAISALSNARAGKNADGTVDTKLQNLKTQADNAYTAYKDALTNVDKNLANLVDKNKNDIDTYQQQLYGIEDKYDKQNKEVEKLKAALEAAERKIKALNDKKKEILSSNSSADTSKIDEAIAAATSERDTIRTNLEKAQRALNDIETEKNNMASKLSQAKTEKTQLDAQVKALNNQTVNNALNTYNTNQKAYDDAKESKISTAQQAVNAAQTDLTAKTLASADHANSALASKFTGTNGENLVKYAEQFLGYNESDGSADIFLGGSSSRSIAWCAAFVQYNLEHCGNQLPSWYSNVDSPWSCGSYRRAAEAAGAVKSGNEIVPGDLVLFDWEGDGEQDHIGIVVSVDGNQVTTIEGNTSNTVAYRNYNINDGRILEYLNATSA